MNILVGNIGSTSLKSKLIRFTTQNIAELLGEANLDKIKSKETSPPLARICDPCFVGTTRTLYVSKSGCYNFRIFPHCFINPKFNEPKLQVSYLRQTCIIRMVHILFRLL